MHTQPSEKEVLRVLACLRDLRRHPLDEIVVEYNNLYPPSILFPVKKGWPVIKSVLDFAVATGYVSAEVLTFYAEPIHPTKFYTLTGSGIQYLHRRR